MTRGAGKEGLSKRYRLSGRGSFTAVLGGGRKVRGARSVLHVRAGGTGQSRLGIAVAKRLARRAIDRNRIKRLAREVFRRHVIKSKGLDLVVALRQPLGKVGPDWSLEVADLLIRACDGP